MTSPVRSAKGTSMASTDRDLLLGVLALQAGLLSREVLLEALRASAPTSDGLGRVLRERQLLPADEQALLEALVETHLKRHDNDAQQSLAALHPDAGTLPPASNLVATLNTLCPPPTTPSDPANAATLDPLPPTQPGTAPAGHPDPAGTTRPAPAGAGRFRILRSHARGGLGEVFVALDGELQREVALKEIQARHARSAESQARFVLEAEVTGRLEHPGIVPVYGLGLYADGRPYYAMRFIKGDSLEEAIRHFHQSAPPAAKARTKTLALRKLLGRFLGVCDAIAYAHSKGILHRDLKPANVMLGPYGETLVVDWGLAKAIGQKEVCATSADEAARTTGGSTVTQAGTVLGTPAYMSPEQAAGNLDELGPASDVYSLGATLYHLLTGRVPFEDRDVSRVLEQVREGRFPAPRALDGSVPAALEAICLKAMARRPADRYLSARALADDLEHWLADEPVAAFPEPWWLRAARWRRRHQALVSSATALGVTVLVALGISHGLLVREQGRTRQAESDRIKAQVEALLDANPQAVPALLEGLEPFRDRVTPYLRELLARPGLSPRQRLRARLALLRDDAQQLPALGRRLPAPDLEPEELLLLCKVLAPHRAALTADLWSQVDLVGTPPQRRFRCLVALARLDPHNQRWPAVAAGVVEPLLGSDPLHVGVWAEALRPVRNDLLDPLGRAFRDAGRPAERRAAAGILREYAADRPELLADLLADADEHQFALLLPCLESHRQIAVDLLKRELARTLTPAWEAPSKSLAHPTPAVKREVEEAAGMVAGSFALCQTLPLHRFPAVAEALGRAGYRPTRLRLYLAGAEVRAAVVWLRDGRAWRSVQGVTAEEVRRRDAEVRRQGYRPVDVAGWAGPAERYAALWARPGDAKAESRLLVGVPLTRRPAIVEPFRTDGLLPQTCQVFPVAGEAPRYSAVWARTAASFDFTEVYAVAPDDYAEALTADLLLLDVSLTAAAPGNSPRLRYTALWHHGGKRTAVAVHGLDPAAHLERCRELAQQGYRPASVAAIAAEAVHVPLPSTASVWHRPVIAETALDALARRQANAAAALMRLGEPELAWPLLHHSRDPRRRTYLLHRLGPLGVDAGLVARRLEVEPDASARLALILSLGRFAPEQLPPALRARLVPRLLDWYRDDPDPGVHGAVGWLLRHGTEGPEPRRIDWGQGEALRRIDAELTGKAPGKRRWYVNRQGQTLTVVGGPVEFAMGSPYQAPQRRSDEVLHRRRIGRTFAIATTTVTAEQYQKFLRAHPEVRHTHPREYSPEPDGPAMTLNWYETAQYCRWLSEQEGIPEAQMCYPSVAEIEKCKDGKAALKLPADALTRTGYRLPTEAEWEFACRARSETTRFFGYAEEMLGMYAWYAPNARDRTWPVARKMPNDLGLFDMQGNVWQWCHNEYLPYPPGRVGRPAADGGGSDTVLGDGSRALRGGTFFLHGSSLRSAFRLYDRPTYPFLTFGFRVARTLP